jgi:hypothetical protein
MLDREGSGILGHPLTGRRSAPTRWRVVTAEFVERPFLTARLLKQNLAGELHRQSLRRQVSSGQDQVEHRGVVAGRAE